MKYSSDLNTHINVKHDVWNVQKKDKLSPLCNIFLFRSRIEKRLTMCGRCYVQRFAMSNRRTDFEFQSNYIHSRARLSHFLRYGLNSKTCILKKRFSLKNVNAIFTDKNVITHKIKFKKKTCCSFKELTKGW